LRIIKEYPKTPYAVDRKFATGLIYYDYGHYEQALKLFEDIGVNHKDSQYAADARYNEMYYYFLTAKWEQAFQSSIKTLGEVLKIPKELDGNIKIIAKESGLKQAGIYSNAKQYAKADAIYQSLLSVFAKGNDHLDILGLSYLSIVEQGDVKRHFSMGKEILAKFKSHPLRPDIAFALGKTYYEMGNFAPAIRLTCPFSTHYIQHGKAEEALGICAQSNLNINRKKQAAEALLKQAQTFLEGEASKEAAIQAGQLFSGLGSRDLAQVSYQHFLTLPGTKDEGHQLQAQAFLWDLEGKIETGMEREAQWLIEKISTLSYDQRNSIDKMIHDKLLNYLKKQVEDEISMAKIEGKLNDELNKQKKRVGPIQKTYESITRLKDTGYNIAAEFEMGRMWKEWHKTLETYASTQSNKNRVNRELNLVKTKYELHLNRAAAFQERSDITSSYNKIIYNKLAELDPQKYRYKEIKHLDPLYTRRSVELGKWPPE
jgi:hypothetical protein